MSVIKVDTILNKDGTGGPILSGLTTVGVLTSGLSIGSTNAYFEYAGIGIVTSVTSIGVANVWASGTLSGTLSGDGSSITAINASNISSGTISDSRFPSNVTFSGIVTATGGIVADVTGNLTGDVVGDVTGTATTATNVTVADESSDTSCNVLFVTAATGNLPPKTGTNLTFNSSTGALTATSFVGDLTGDVTGNADTATSATSATTATNATNITLADESSDTTCFPVFATSATGNQAPKTDSDRLTYNASSGLLVATTHQSTNMIADSTMRVGSATTSNSLYVIGNSASNVVNLGSQASSFAPNFSLGNNFAFTIGGNITLNNPTGITTGQSGIIEITQDGTGSRTLAFQSYWMFADGTAPTITAGAGTTSVLTYFVRDYNAIVTTSVLALG